MKMRMYIIHTIVTISSVFFFNQCVVGQVEKRCAWDDTVFTNGCVLPFSDVRLLVCLRYQPQQRFTDETIEMLDRIVVFMNKNESVQLTIESHTDHRGNDSLNRVFSKRLSDAVAGYLIEKGVDAFRLVCKGYGEDKPAFVYFKDGEHFDSVQVEKETIEVIELNESYINQFRLVNRTTYELLHLFNRRTLFRVSILEDCHE